MRMVQEASVQKQHGLKPILRDFAEYNSICILQKDSVTSAALSGHIRREVRNLDNNCFTAACEVQ